MKKKYLVNIKRKIPTGVRVLYNKFQGKGYASEFYIPAGGIGQGIDTNVIKSESSVEIETDIKIKKSMTLKSRRKDYYINQLLLKKKWNFKNMRYVLDPYNCSPLSALFLFYTEEKCKVRFTVRGHTKEEDITDETEYARYHRVPVYGLYAGEENRIRVEILDRRGAITDAKEVRLKTEPLPEVLKDLVYDVSKKAKPGLPLVFLTGGSEVYPCAIDCNGNIRYYLNSKTTVYGVFPLKNGHFFQSEQGVFVPTFAHQHSVIMHEMDYLGRIHNTFVVEKGLHHFATELPNGNILGVSNTMENHTEDSIVEIERATGKIVKTIKLIDVLGDTYADMTDWVHPNSIQYFPDSHELMLCLRNVHTVLRLDYDTLEIKWMLATSEMWKGTPLQDKVLKPVGDVRWHYQSHAAQQLFSVPDGKDNLIYIMLFDNHRINRRPVNGFDEAEESFVILYGVDEKQGTVCQIHEYAVPKSLIRSNGIYDHNSDRIYAMAGVLVSEQDKDARVSEIWEFDYATEEALNRMKIQKDFFSAYPFMWDMKGLAAPICQEESYRKGQAACAVKCGDGLENELSLFGEDSLILNCYITEDLLFLKMRDHSVDCIYFVGEKNTYMKDYTDTYQTMERFSNGIYYVLLSLDNLEKDMYEIVTEAKGAFYRTHKCFQIL